MIETKTFESAPFAGQGSLPVIAQIGDCVERDEDIHTLQNHAVNLSCKLKKNCLTIVTSFIILSIFVKNQFLQGINPSIACVAAGPRIA